MKVLKIGLAISLLLNVGMIVGFGSYRKLVRTQNYKLAAATVEAEASLFKSILSDLNSDDPERIIVVKRRLEKYIENGNDVMSVWQQAVKNSE